MIFVVENNGYGLSTPVSEQYACENIADRGLGYGMPSLIIDGNNILEVYRSISDIAKKMRQYPGPVLVECKTFRIRGHEEASGTKYVPKEMMDYWALRDPIQNYETYLISEGLLSHESIDQIKMQIQVEIDHALQTASEEPVIHANAQKELDSVFAQSPGLPAAPSTQTFSEKRFIDAISDGLEQAMAKDENLILMGQDIAEYGGVFKITEGFVEKFGKERVRNTPICESAIVGIALGLNLKGFKAMIEMQFADFVACGFNQIVNNLAKVHYRWGQEANVVIRMPTGGGVAAGPFHSQSNEAWFTHTPGLKVVYPSNPRDAKGLLLASFEDPNPVLFFEHKALYRSLSDQVPDGFFLEPLGEASVFRTGSEATVITYGMGVHWAKKVVEELNAKVEIIDLRTLQPLDYETIEKSVQNTNRVIILHEDTLFGGIGGEIAAHLAEHHFEDLDAPIIRVASMDTPVPFAPILEQMFLPVQRFKQQLEKLLSY